ncbi:hypothetical protein [Neoroseomonas rubea]|uniref:hypothetical protein n=1 Tax=Neoroseomonas rubea TaxID=2748666 RepID=UPI0018DF3C8E|nr:hypothetical protein [Roseomonas rubea]
MRSALLLAAVLAVAAPPARAAETSLPALMRLLPPPMTGALQPGQVLLSYARVDLLAGGRGPTPGAGATRAAAIGRIAPLGFHDVAMAQVEQWPSGAGFDFDAIEALLVLETGGMPNGVRVLAGARMPSLATLAGPLAARGFAPRSIAGQPVLVRGADNAPNPQHRAPGDALGGGLAFSLRYAAPAPGVLLATREDATMAAAFGDRRLADVPELRALADTSAGGPGARDLAQAVVYVMALRSAPPILPGPIDEVRRALTAEMRDTDTLPGPPPWVFAMLSERRDADGIITRLALPYRLRPAAEAAAEAMAARLAAMAPLPGLGAVGRTVVEQAADGIFVAAIEARQRPGTDATLFATINGRHHRGMDTPMTIGPVPRAAFAR